MLTLSLTLTLVFAAADGERLSLAAPGVSAAVNIDEKLGAFYYEHLAQQLAFQGLSVTTARQVAEILGFERQRELLGCNEHATDCVVELGNALGVDGLLMFDVAKVGRVLQANIRILSVVDGRALTAHSVRVESEEALLDELSDAATQMAAELSRKLEKPLVATGDAASGRKRSSLSRTQKLAWAPALVGLAAGAGGAYLLVQAKDRHEQLVTRTGNPIDAQRALVLRDEGWRFQRLGLVAAGVGAAGLATGAGMYLFGGRSRVVQSGVALTPGGVTIAITGVLP